FAQFASDLDANTRATLSRGERMMEVLKQGQYAPMSVLDQVITIFAGTQGLWDRVPTESITTLEPKLIKYVHERYPELTRHLEETLALSDEDAEALRVAITDFIDKQQAETK
ncbi:MAG: F0F1 ATP synthase subunit alpha, partial [Bacteroidota bacterium]